MRDSVSVCVQHRKPEFFSYGPAGLGVNKGSFDRGLFYHYSSMAVSWKIELRRM
jgi:hypothetical protein